MKRKPLKRLSRARRYQIRHKAAGLCIYCRKRGKNGLCARHRLLNRARSLASYHRHKHTRAHS